jgi:hypothetical protein
MTQFKPQTEAQQIAGAILDQFGARRFMVMTGARGVVALPQGLQFQLPAKAARDGINMVRVELDEFDLYRVVVGRWQRLDFTEKAREQGLLCADLHAAFTRLTGLETHL